MKNRQLFIIAAFFAVFSGTCWAIRDPMTGNPIGSGTVPPSSYSSGLVHSPNPIDTSSNLVITGNVAGGKYFRGIVPYRSTSSFGTELGSSEFDSFLRGSAGSSDFGRSTGGYTPYWPSSTIATTRPGQSGVFRPSTTSVESGVRDTFTLLSLPEEQILSEEDTTVRPRDTSKSVWDPMLNVRFRPVSMTAQRPSKALSGEIEGLAEGERLTPERYQEEMEQLQLKLKQISKRAEELEQSMISGEDFLQLSGKSELTKEVQQQFETQLPKEQKSGVIDSSAIYYKTRAQLEVHEQLKQQIDKLQESYKQLRAAKPSAGAVEGEKQAKLEEPYSVGSLRLGTPLGGTERDILEAWQVGEEMEIQESADRRPVDYEEEISSLGELSEIELSARAKDILGEHESYASYAEDKFNQYIKEAESYLKQGKFYRAADAYTMASIYKPSEPLAYAGKSHALFAAGEYMSSALFLSRALEMFPEYARLKIDIVAVIGGDRDKLESRIADVEQWLKESGAGELQFLLGYIYYRLGRLELAKKAIDSAYEKMPGSPAVVTLRKAIGDTILNRVSSVDVLPLGSR